MTPAHKEAAPATKELDFITVALLDRHFYSMLIILSDLGFDVSKEKRAK